MTRYAPPEEKHDLRITASARALAEADPRATQLFAGRPAVIAQSHLQDRLDRSPRVEAQRALQRALNRGPRAVAQAKLAETLSARASIVQRRSDRLASDQMLHDEEDHPLQGKLAAAGEALRHEDSAAPVQRARSEWYKLRRSQHRVLKRHLERAARRGNASEISALIFHNGQRIKSIPTIHKGSRGFPSNDYAFARHGEDSTQKYDDGELHLIDEVQSFLPDYLASIREDYDQSGNYHTYPPFDASKQQQGHEILIEMIGPKGTCEDCQEALGRYLHDLEEQHPKTAEGVPIQFEINTRYLVDEDESYRGKRVEARSARGLSPYYGSHRAKLKRRLGRINATGIDNDRVKLRDLPEHFKLKIRRSMRRGKRPVGIQKGRHILFGE